MTTTKEVVQLTVKGQQKSLKVDQVICIGYSGRDQAKVKEHIEELAEIGVPRPNEVPALFPMRRSSLETEGLLEVVGEQTSGEAEPVLVFGEDENEVYLTLGSDHTDRELETVHIGKSKQVCDKPIAEEAWDLKEVVDHWDDLILSSEIYIDGEWVPYQNNPVSAIMPYEDLKNHLKNQSIALPHSVFLIGTVPLLSGFKFGSAHRMSLKDPVAGEEITLEYKIEII
ncbi:uncharacterized protein DUF2848 [Sinobaca qinghaiensis]|uniref:Uncharacterized protein DUF2848 n=1 Tax=Sinobaca qinghaiensis TaxID=342944 RepID=A0A419V5D7_9BACL|nr:DUF2848 family protein [Sinobaca qinghaiensis]RKD75168.1 uncharacterized protein DUF2848 [Sinobaca qinghaiensis]